MLKTEGPTLKLVQGYHGSITRVAFSPDSSHFTVVWQEFEEEPTLSFNVYSLACQRLACFEDEAVLIDASLAFISGNRLAVAHLGDFDIRYMSSGELLACAEPEPEPELDGMFRHGGQIAANQAGSKLAFRAAESVLHPSQEVGLVYL